MGALVWEYFTFAGKSTEDFSVRISGNGTFDAPSRDVTKVSVPGRNGDLTFDNGRFENIEIVYPAFITENFDANFGAFKAFLGAQRGYKRLADSYHPDFYRRAIFKEAIKPQMAPRNGSGSFEIRFDCDPRMFLKKGEKALQLTSFPAVLKNPTQYTASPIVRVYNAGTLTINGVSVVISSMKGTVGSSTVNVSYVDVDCEIEEGFSVVNGNLANCNLYITTIGGKFPKLQPGNNTINWTNSRIDITPRYYTI